MGDAPPADAPPADPAAAPPADAAAAPPAGPPSIAPEPAECNVPAGGGTSTHQLKNPSGVQLSFKCKSTNNSEYRLNPVFGFVDAGGATPLEITRTAGPPKQDKLVVQFVEAPADAADASALWKGATPLGDVTIPMNAA